MVGSKCGVVRLMLFRHQVNRLPKRVVSAPIWLVPVLVAQTAWAQQADFGRDCAASAFVESSVGIVTVAMPGVAVASVSRNLQLCPGDEVVTGPNGRVAIRFEESRTVIRLNRNSKLRVRSTGTDNSGVGLLQGILYFISSVRTQFTIETPYIVAGIDGTEALAGVDGDVELVAVREGLLGAYDRAIGPGSRLAVPAGDAAYRSSTVRFSSAPIDELPPPFSELLITSDSAVDWAVYYPPIEFVERPAGRADAEINAAIELLRSGNYDAAIAALDRADAAAPAETAALRTIIAIARNRIDEAERWSAVALTANPDFAPAYVAASYVRQAVGDLNGGASDLSDEAAGGGSQNLAFKPAGDLNRSALDYAYAAAEIAPDDAHVMARLAELQMIVGDRRGALRSAEWSLGIAPTSLALFVEGLARLAAWQYERAEDLFAEAINLDSQAPLPRLGLGLAYIRQGKTAAGAWQMELAVAHDPKRASLRTWLGRAYYDEGLDNKASEQFDLAKEDDAEDPTPYLFSALERYAANDPIGALEELRGAEARGGARSVLRSARGLGEDTATVGAALGRVYDVLGFDQLAVNAGAAAIDADPANPGAHRFLADAYRQQPGAEIAQTSELLRSQLLSPPSSTPVQPELAEARLGLLDTTGPSRVTFAEFAPLFDSDGVRLDGSGLYGTQGTWGLEGAVTGLYRNASISVGQFHYETDGYRENNDLTHDIFDAISTIALSPELSLFGEYRHRESEGGDRRLNFDIGDSEETFRGKEEQDVARLGFHAQPTANSDVIGVYTWANLSNEESASVIFGGIDFGKDIDFNSQDSHSGQLQYIHDYGLLRGVVGVSYFNSNIKLGGELLGIQKVTETSASEFYNGYAYYDLDLFEQLTLTAGGSVVRYRLTEGGSDIFQFDPKIGATAKLGDQVTLRAAYFRIVKPDFVSDQVIEPTTIAGFNQYFDAFNGSVLEQVGAGIDVALGDRTWIGAEAIGRWWDVPVPDAPDADTTEEVYRAYFYTTLSENVALSAEIAHQASSSDAPFDLEEWKTTAAPVALIYFSESGLFGSVGVEFVDHSYSDPGDGEGRDSFALVNLGLGYRLAANRGVFSVEVQNLFDEHFEFQNRTIRPDLTAAARYAPERTVLARGTVHF
jgi:tetratricopeptide (TPR) repeat protein